MSLTVEHLAPLHIALHISISPEEYLPAFEKKCKEISKDISIKGFRKGMVPPGLIKKQFGPKILNEVVAELSDDLTENYFENNNLQPLARPLSLNDEAITLDYTDTTKTYTFSFEFGLKPEIDITPLFNPNIEFVRYTTEADKQTIQEDIEILRRRQGTIIQVEDENDSIQLTDVIDVLLEELDNDGNVKENGVSNSTTITPQQLKAGLEQDLVLQLKVNESATINLFDAFDKDRETVAKQVLNVKENAENLSDKYKITIIAVKRLSLPELNEAFYNNIFPDVTITTHEEFIELLTARINQNYENQSRNLFIRQLKKKIPKIVNIPLPEIFLRKLLVQNNNEFSDDEKWNAEMEEILFQFRWSLIQNFLADKYEIEVTEDDIFETLAFETYNHFKNKYQIELPEEYVLKYTSEQMKDKNKADEVFHSLQEYYSISALIDELKVTDVLIPLAEFTAMMDNISEATVNELSQS